MFSRYKLGKYLGYRIYHKLVYLFTITTQYLSFLAPNFVQSCHDYNCKTTL